MLIDTGNKSYYAAHFVIFVCSSFLKGDMFIVHNELDDGWMWVTNVRTEEQGLIVEDLVEEVVSVVVDISMIGMHLLWS